MESYNMQIIWNGNKENILEHIEKHLKSANEVWVAVAFLKNTGLDLLVKNFERILKRGGNINIIAGRNFYITEPDALYTLLDLLKKHDGSNLYLANEDPTFHPKLFRIVNGKKVIIIVGSANMTRGGLCDNIEACMSNIVNVGSVEDERVKQIFDEIISQKYSEIASPINVGRYESKYKKRSKLAKKMINDLEKEFKKELKDIPQPKFDEKLLKRYIVKFNKDKNYPETWERRKGSYIKAKKLLDKLESSPPLTKKEFLEDYSKLVKGLFWSGSIYRSKNMVAMKYKKFCEMVAEIKENKNLPAEDLFEMCLKYKRSIKGLGVNVITEVLHTYNPKNCPVLNNSPIESLKYFGITDFPHPTNFRPEHYLKLKHMLEYLQGVCDLESLGMVDTFLNDVYWDLKKKGKID